MKEFDNLKVTNDDRTLLIYLIHQEFKRIAKENRRATTSDFCKSHNQQLKVDLDLLLSKVVLLFSRREDKDDRL